MEEREGEGQGKEKEEATVGTGSGAEHIFINWSPDCTVYRPPPPQNHDRNAGFSSLWRGFWCREEGDVLINYFT
jgi:hypothetical protein